MRMSPFCKNQLLGWGDVDGAHLEAPELLLAEFGQAPREGSAEVVPGPDDARRLHELQQAVLFNSLDSGLDLIQFRVDLIYLPRPNLNLYHGIVNIGHRISVMKDLIQAH